MRLAQIIEAKGAEVVTTGPETEVYDAAKMMTFQDIKRLPVVDDDSRLLVIFDLRCSPLPSLDMAAEPVEPESWQMHTLCSISC